MTCKCFYDLKGMDSETRAKMVIYIGLMASVAGNAAYQRINRVGKTYSREALHDCGLVAEILERFTPLRANVLPDHEEPPEHIVNNCISLLEELQEIRAVKSSNVKNSRSTPLQGNTTEAQVARVAYRKLPMPPPIVWWQRLL